MLSYSYNLIETGSIDSVNSMAQNKQRTITCINDDIFSMDLWDQISEIE